MAFYKYLLIYSLSLLVFIIIDSFWLTKVTPKLYKQYVSDLLADKPMLLAAAIFYLIFILGLTVFVTVPALNSASLWQSVYLGALFGLAAYGTFDLTAQAVFKNWPWLITLIDIAWGVFISSAVSAIAYLISKRFII